MRVDVEGEKKGMLEGSRSGAICTVPALARALLQETLDLADGPGYSHLRRIPPQMRRILRGNKFNVF